MDIKTYIAERLKSLPMKIISAAIYGSWAKGTHTVDSDIDLLIISNEVNPKKHKRGKDIVLLKECITKGFPLDILLLTKDECISNFRNHNPLFLDIAYDGIILFDEDNFLNDLIAETRAYIFHRKLEKLEDGWRFPVLYREATYLSNISNRDFAMAMLTDGERDFYIAQGIMKEGYNDKAVYHFQQAAEKAIKAVLISFGEFKKSHFVGAILLEKLKEMEIENEWREKLSRIAKISEEIEPEVTWSRYPGIDKGALWLPYEEYSNEDALEVMQKSKEVFDTAKYFVQWWFRERMGSGLRICI